MAAAERVQGSVDPSTAQMLGLCAQEHAPLGMTKWGEGHIEMIELRSMAVAMPEVVGHPNRRAFRGVLTMVDVASERAPSGSRGHRVLLTKRAAEAALPSLLGMALDYSPALDRHDVRRKVGVITRADIVGRNVELGGYLFARDFPEIVEEIAKSGRGGSRQVPATVFESAGMAQEIHAGAGHQNAEGRGLQKSLMAVAERMFSLAALMQRDPNTSRHGVRGFCPMIRAEACVAATGRSGLGLSYEVTEVQVENSREQVWKLSKVTFTGAAILRRDKAAYRDTWIELSV